MVAPSLGALPSWLILFKQQKFDLSTVIYTVIYCNLLRSYLTYHGSKYFFMVVEMVLDIFS